MKQLFVQCFLLVLLTAPGVFGAQYFGQNKVQYRTFDFEVLTTDHFEIYYYEEEAEAVEMVARMAERWYRRLSEVLEHELVGRQRVIVYASHPEFRQTNAIPGDVGETTGGVTEAFKRRIVLPMAGTLSDTDHVLGHELVHAFQYDITTQRANAGAFALPGVLRLPLWFVEGMAEYLSIGSVDAHTAMWVRDALASDNLPDVRQLSNPRFFPYRYGHAFWAYVAARWGDQAVGQMLKAAGRTGTPESAINQVLSISAEELSRDWHEAIRTSFDRTLEATSTAEAYGRPFFGDGSARLNVSPSLSPDGNSVVFFSERDLFSIDMFLADVETGRILRKITDTVTDPHLESLQFVSSSGAWSRDGRRFAFGAIAGGRPRLTIVEPQSGRESGRFPLPELGEIFNPTWSPDGERIAFSAIADGLTDLFVLNLNDGSLNQLTRDPYSVLHPSWSPDGQTIAFATDRFTSDLETLSFGDYRIALFDLATEEISELQSPLSGKHVNPQWSPDGTSLYLLSDSDGITNLYRIEVETGGTEVLTALQTGITGITAVSPALSVSEDERAVVSVFEAGRYRLVVLPPRAAGVSSPALENRPDMLPPGSRSTDTVARYLADPEAGLPIVASATEVRRYRPSLSLDYVVPPSLSLGASSFGTFVGGGTALYWSDILGEHNLFTAAELNTEGSHFFRNLSGAVGYQNRRRRWNWGGIIAQSPFRSGFLGIQTGLIGGQPVVIEDETRLWEIRREVAGTLAYPINRAQRVEFSAGFRNISFVADNVRRVFLARTGQQISREQEDLAKPDPLRMAVSTAALVYDQTVFGAVSPLIGQRYRFEASATVGALRYRTVLADYRRYVMPLRPITIAARLLHFGRYASDAEDSRLQPLYVGDEHLVRGYDLASFDAAECRSAVLTNTCPVFDRLVGSRIGVVNLEVRAPLFGPLGVISQLGLPVELAAFLDAGTAWNRGETPAWLGGDRPAVSSHGASLRVNVLGMAVVQLSLVHPNDRPLRNWMWQFGLTQGF